MWHAWRKGEVFRGFCLGGPKGRDHWEDLGASGRITLRLTPEAEIDGAKWIRLAQDGVQWGALVSMVMNLRIPKIKQAVV
jgi:hypothetical protein